MNSFTDPLTGKSLRDFLLNHSETEVNQYWQWLQRYKRARGEFHYTKLVDPVTNKVIAIV